MMDCRSCKLRSSLWLLNLHSCASRVPSSPCYHVLQLKVGKIGDNSYIPAGLSKAEYEKIRANDQKKRDENYKKNVAKAGKYIDFTDWYKKRGTDTEDSWIKSVTRGHTMVKTKYDYSGSQDNKKLDQSV